MDPCRRLLAFQPQEAYPATGGAAIRPPDSRSHAKGRQDPLRSGQKTMAVQDLRRQETALSGPAESPEKNATPPASAWQRLRPEPGRSGRGNAVADFNRHPRRHFGGRRSAAASAIVGLGLERLQCRHGHRPIPLFRLPECHRTQHHADRYQGNQCPPGRRTPETAWKSGHDRFSPGAGIETRPGKPRPQKASRQTLPGTVAGNPTPVSPPPPAPTAPSEKPAFSA